MSNRGYPKNENRKVKASELVQAACIFFACYILMLFVLFVMLVLHDINGWLDFCVNRTTEMFSLCICIFLLYFIIYFYYYFENKEFLVQSRNILCIFTIITVCVVLCSLAGTYVNVYVRPAALLSIVCVFIFNRRQAIILNFVFFMLVFIIDNYTNGFGTDIPPQLMYYSIMRGFVCGTLAIFVANSVKTRGGILLTGAIIAVPTVAIAVLFEFSDTGVHIQWLNFVEAIGWSVLGCMLSSILAIAFLPVLEVMFNRLTVFRLRELTRTDASLLVRLKKEAPGTFNHSLIVAQLAESCALAINENAEIARAAAYYHDVGKLKQPDCFTENQSDYNIHNELTPELSADIIRSHAKDGYDLLIANHFPQIIADVACEHHGTMPIKFFYAKAMKISGGDADIGDYSYLGPTPRSKIAAIVMIADSSEAAVRSLKEHSPENVERVVRSIIEERMDLEQFVDCNITIRELTTIKQTLVDALSGVHHHRVKYPAIRFNRERKAVEEQHQDD